MDLLKNSKKTVGLKQSLKALQSGEAMAVIIARDADERIIKEVEDMCSKSGIEVTYADEMKKLGKACNISVGTSVVCILK